MVVMAMVVVHIVVIFSQKKEASDVESNIIVPIPQKVMLTVKEASAYSNIGINKIDKMLRMPNCPFAFYVGAKKLVKRKEFEKYISDRITI